MNRSGMVLSSAIVKKSGSYDLDQAALDRLNRFLDLNLSTTSPPCGC
ncbi:energy transducer TonB [Sphingopyxis terrae]|nr:hypothetical protein [Sphingopyxis terrae]